MQFKVPQNIAMEDRIVGNLTAIQFGILVIGGLAAFTAFGSTTLPSPINKGFGLMLAIFTVISALGKFNNQPMYRFYKSVIIFLMSPKIRVWHKVGAERVLIQKNTKKIAEENTFKAKSVTKKDIAQLAQILDTRGKTGSVPVPQTITMERPKKEEDDKR